MYPCPLKCEDWVGLGGAGGWILHTGWDVMLEAPGEACAVRVSVRTSAAGRSDSAARKGQAFPLWWSVAGCSNALRISPRSHHQWTCAVLPDPECLLTAAGQKAAPYWLPQAPAFGDFIASSSLSPMLGAAAGHFILVLTELRAIYIALSTSTVFKTVEQKRLFTRACCSAIAELSRE